MSLFRDAIPPRFHNGQVKRWQAINHRKLSDIREKLQKGAITAMLNFTEGIHHKTEYVSERLEITRT